MSDSTCDQSQRNMSILAFRILKAVEPCLIVMSKHYGAGGKSSLRDKANGIIWHDRRLAMEMKLLDQ